MDGCSRGQPDLTQPPETQIHIFQVVLEDNNILFPQREVLARGTTATIKFLREYNTAKSVWDKGSFGKNSKLGTQNRRRLQPNVDMSEAETSKTLGVSALSWSVISPFFFALLLHLPILLQRRMG
jgi:hypothetical protein